MHSKFFKISAAFFFAAALFSCSFDAPESDKGSISMRLPDQSQLSGSASVDSLDGVSHSVSSGGSISAGSVDQFKVVVRNISSHESITQFVAPGSSITVDELEPGSWDVAIFGYASTGTSGDPIYYGNARGIAVEGGETSNATVGLYNISANMPGFGFNGVDPSDAMNIQYAYMTWSCSELGQGGEEFYACSFTAGGDPNHPELKPPVPVFMEPGYNYKAQVIFYVTGGLAEYTGSIDGLVPANGGLVEGNVAQLDNHLNHGNTNTPYVIGNSFADYASNEFVQFTLDDGTTSVPCVDASYKAVNSEACGGSVPYIASYGAYSCILTPLVHHPSPVPSVSVPNQTVQKGQTITVSAALNPPAPKAWPKLTTEAEVNGFSRYIVDSANSDSDTWAHVLDCSDPSADKVTVNDTNKTLTGAAAGSNNFRWTVTVTAGSFGETPASSTATANFTATCVVPTQPSGGGSGNVPEGFVFVEGTTINSAVSGSSVFLDGRKIVIPDMLVCTHEVTQGEYEQYCIYPGSKPSDSYGKGTNYPAYYVCWYDAILYCNLRSAAEGLEPVYYVVTDGTTNTASLDWTSGTKSYDVNDWTTVYDGYFIRTDTTTGKLYCNTTDMAQVLNSSNRGVTMDKSRNGYRLLTEAEWEYCARGGKNGIAGAQTTYSGSDTLENVAWCRANSGGKTHPVCTDKLTAVDSFNTLGLYDMSGNVAEYVYDWYGASAINSTTPETGYIYNSSDNQSRSKRGGYFDSYYDSDYYVKSRSSCGEYRGQEVGFRICRNASARNVTGFNGIWSISPPQRQTVARNTGVVNFFFQNNAATKSDYDSFDRSKLLIKYGDTTYNFDSTTMECETQSTGVLWKMTNPNTSSGTMWFTFTYDGVEIGYGWTLTN